MDCALAGGNFEPVRAICRSNWKECPRSIAKYIWREIVTDVIDSLRTDGVAWLVIAGIFIGTFLLYAICNKGKKKPGPNTSKRMLTKVGCKVQDLELKINMLTYKMQYGAWPLPHQLQGTNMKNELRRVRLTLSNPDDRNVWIKRMFMNSASADSNTTCKSCEEKSSASRLIEVFKMAKEKNYNSNRKKRNSDSSAILTSSSDRCSKKSSEDLNSSNLKQQVQKNKKTELRRRDFQSLSLLPGGEDVKENFCGKRIKQWSGFSASCVNSKPYDKCGDTLRECKNLMKPLQPCNRKFLFICTSTEGSMESLIADVPTQRTTSTAENQNKTQGSDVKSIEISQTGSNTYSKRSLTKEECTMQSLKNYTKIINTLHEAKKSMDNKLLPAALNVMFNATIYPKNFVTPSMINLRMPGPATDETLYQVKKKLESLQNVLGRYSGQDEQLNIIHVTGSSREQISTVCQNVVDTLSAIRTEVEKIYRKRQELFSTDVEANRKTFVRNGNDSNGKTIYLKNKNNANFTVSSKSSSTSVVSNANIREIQHNVSIQTLHIDTISGTTQTLSCPVNRATSICTYPFLTSNNCYTERRNVESALDTVNAKRIPERICYTLTTDSDMKRNEDMQLLTVVKKLAERYPVGISEQNPFYFLNEKRSSKWFSANKSSYPMSMETEEDVIVTSQSSSWTELSKLSDREDKSTVMLLQEALQFKKALLTRVELGKFYRLDEIVEGNKIYEPEYKIEDTNNYQQNMLEMIAEEQSAISGSTSKSNETYVFAKTVQSSMLLKDSLQVANISKTDCRKSKTLIQDVKFPLSDTKEIITAIPSEYFSTTNVINHEYDEVPKYNLKTTKTLHNPQNNITNIVPSKTKGDLIQMSPGTDKKWHEKLNCKEMDQSNDFMTETVHKPGEPVTIAATDKNKGEATPKVRTVNELVFRHVKDIKEYTKLFSQTNKNSICETKNATPQQIETENFNLFEVEDSLTWDQLLHSTCSSNMQLSIADSSNEDVTDIISNIKINLNPTLDNSDTMCYDSPNLSLRRRPGAFCLVKQEISPSHTEVIDMFKNHQSFLQASVSKSNNTLPMSLMQKLLAFNILKTNTLSVSEVTCTENKVPVTTMRDTKKATDISENTNLHNVHSNTITNNKDENCTNYNLISDKSNLYFTDDLSGYTTPISKNPDLNINQGSKDMLDGTSKYKDKKFNKDNTVSTNESPIIHPSSSNAKDAVTSTNVECETWKVLSIRLNETEMPICVANSDLSNNIDAENIYNPITPINNIVKFQSDKVNADIEMLHSHDYANKRDSISPSRSITAPPTPSGVTSSMKKSGTVTLLPRCASASSLQHYKHYPEKSISEQSAVTNKCKNVDSFKAKGEKLTTSVRHSATSPAIKTTYNMQPKVKINTNLRSSRNDVPAELNKQYPKQNKYNLHHERPCSDVTVHRNNAFPQHIEACSEKNNENNNNSLYQNNVESITQLKSATPSKTFSKSCIPILKSRLEAFRQTEHETRPKSPTRSPLTMTMLWKNPPYNNSNYKTSDTIVPAEGTCPTKTKGQTNETTYTSNYDLNDELFTCSRTIDKDLKTKVISKDETVIYVSIISNHDRSITKIVNPKRFLEHLKNSELKISKNTKKLTPSLTNSWCIAIGCREIDVTAKPSVTNTSTSISDLQICNMTEELTKEEYIILLQTLKQDPNSIHLEEIRNLCIQIVSNYKSE